MHLVMDFPCTKKNIYFSKVGPNKGKAIKCQIYQVKKYIYAWINVSFLMKLLVKDRYAWIGYVAVDIDEGTRLLGRRDILICWRGTYNIAEWEKNISFLQTHIQVIYPTVPDAKVHRGFYSIYTEPDSESKNESARDQIMFKKIYNNNKLFLLYLWLQVQLSLCISLLDGLKVVVLNFPFIQVIEEVKNLVNLYQNEKISIVIRGWGLGAGLAMLNIADIVSNRYNLIQTRRNSWS